MGIFLKDFFFFKGFFRATTKTAANFFSRSVLVTGLIAGFGVQSALADSNINPALWKLSDEDSVVWIFGTVHALDPNLQWRTEKIKQAFSSADSFYMEAPVTETSQEEMIPLLQ